MALTYVPTSGQSLNATRDLIYNNFVNIEAGFDVDHGGYNNGSVTGLHNKVSLSTLTAAPTFTSMNGLYSLPVTYGGGTYNEVYVHKQRVSGYVDIPFTQSILSASSPSSGEAGWTYLPSGIILNWGTGISNSSGVGSVTFSKAFGTAVLNVQFTIYTSSTPATSEIFWTGATTSTASCLTAVNGTIAALGFSYLAIGY